jgi:hypothetical protein
MGQSVEKLLAHQHAEDCYTVPLADIRNLQVAAMNERLQENLDRIKLVKFRAEAAQVSEIRSLADIVPLLLPHTAYKSYPESYLIGERWDKLTKWLATVSAYPVGDVDLDGVDGVDEWITRLEDAGHYVSCSSGTTGKSAMLIATKADMRWVGEDSVVSCAWGTGIAPAQDRLIFRMAPLATIPRNQSIIARIQEAYGKPGSQAFRYPVPPITVGSITRMVALRKAMSDGTAKPNELLEFETTSASREKAMSDALGVMADALIKARAEKLYLSGLWANIYKIAVAVRERGYGSSDFNPENMMYIGGGLKREQLPSNYREVVYETFNVEPGRNFQIYGMQEIGSNMPRCREGGRYHLPPWLVCVPLDRDAEALVPMDQGEVQCRAGFFDLSLDGRWGGVISGDRIEVDFSRCACGARTPSIRDNIARYVDLDGDDKISCAGTVDAYVRGIA